ncbi:CD4-2 molecule, tandem duplicate 2 isoform X2 [Megalobrama amblycephala]|uniref:CD4-2 molecule, tandem duplicate 2 isoform X2 n=1 Tax=Megalobrama amblycephala TaxID=75352 RepID=UPI002013D5E3|nr:CD4-2 molecule, tandem duplicate 2 isoform X2 [Megalobrama amblycephala]
MPTCKILFFLLLALCTSCGECDVKYGQVGGEVSMDCGVPQNSDVEWKLNDILIIKINGRRGTRQKGPSHIKDKVSVNGGSLKVPRLETRDSGVYSCNSGKRYTLHVVSVFAKPGPVLVQSSSAELHCDIDGNPNTEVQWLSPSNDKKDDKKQVIHLKSVTSNDDGQWTCLIKDDLKLSLKLTVVGLQTTAVKVPEGGNIKLPCSLPRSVSQRVVGGKWTADHLPTVSFPTLKNTETKGLHWSGDDSSKVIFTSDQLNINYDVMLINAQPSDEGKYVCTVEFEGGVKLTAETNLMVVAKPSGEGPPPELSVVQDILGVDSPVLAGISGGLESEAEPEEHNTETSQQSKQLQHRQSGSSTPNQAGTKKKQIPSPAAIREELLELQRDVLQLQKIKLQLEIEKLKKEK